MRRAMAVMLFVLFTASNAAAGDLKNFQDRCQSIKIPKAKIERCLSLIEKNQVSRTFVPAVYSEVAYAWATLDDFDRAINFTRTEIRIASENMKKELSSGKLSSFGREAWPKRMSYSYRKLGQYLALARLSGAKDRSDKALGYAKAEMNSYSAAIAYDREDHESYMARAEVESLLCKDSEAYADHQMALRIAQHSNERAYRDYRFKVLPGCVSQWQSK